MRLTDPRFFKTETNFLEGYFVPAMPKSWTPWKKFGVYDEVPMSERTPDEINGALPSQWVSTWKTADSVTAQIVVTDRFQGQLDPDVLYASTPTRVTMRILLLMAIAGNWTIKLLDVSNAFLHAAMLSTVLVVPPNELYPNKY